MEWLVMVEQWQAYLGLASGRLDAG